MAFLSDDAFAALGLARVGRDGIALGRYVHIACNCSRIGDARIELDDFSGLSSRVAV